MLVVYCTLHVVLAMVTHELGHALMARVLGGQAHAIGWGMPSASRSMQWRGVRLFVGFPVISGMSTWTSPPPSGWTRTTWGAVIAGGPLVNLLCAACLWNQPLFAVVHLLHGMANVFPSLLRNQSASDGDQLWRLLRGHTTQHAAYQSLSWRSLLAQAHAFTRWQCRPMAAVLWEQVSRDTRRPLLSQRALQRHLRCLT